MLRKIRKGQSTLEFAVVTIIVIGAFIAMGNYFKRGLQGRWKSTIDDIGEQYDPRMANTDFAQTMVSDTLTQIVTYNTVDGYWTERYDESTATDSKSGYVGVAGY